MRLGLIKAGRGHGDTITLFDKRLNSNIEYAVKKARNIFAEDNHPTIDEFPIFEYDFEGGNGADNVGLIFKQTSREKFPQGYSYNQNNITFRVSFGTNRPFNEKGKKMYWDPETFQRLHLSVYGVRNFFTEEQIEKSIEKGVIGTNSEEVNVSIRWLDDSFDDWHDGEHNFHEKRTTYLAYQKWERGGLDSSEAGEYIKKVGTKKELLKGVVKHHKLVSGYNIAPEMRLEGYKNVLEFLSKYGNTSIEDAVKIPSMNHMGAIDFLLDKVVPSVRDFVRS